jgi:branched-chain amino acid transport system permease protein
VDTLIQQVVSGLATGGIYGSLALALVMIYQATEVVNYAQGQMAVFSTYLAWSMLNAGLPYWVAFAATLAIAFVGGLLIERILIRPVENAPVLTIVIVCIGLLVILNSVSGWIYSYIQKPFPSPFSSRPIQVGNIYFGAHDLGALGVTLLLLAALYAFFRFTTLGLAMRAAAQNPVSSRLCGIRVGWMLAVGWGLAATLGAVSGLMTEPTQFLQPTMMQAILLYAFAAAVLGGLESPAGAVVGGLALGVFLNLIGQYVGIATPELRLPIAFLVLLLVLLVKPTGLFGRKQVRRV